MKMNLIIHLVYINRFFIVMTSMYGQPLLILRKAIEKYGFFQGRLMGWRRIRKCHPRGGSGHEPVP
ncbi:MAG: hypothetical protein CMD29_06905 [Flavobacteriales bacterium]|nr:hypothetical protein [Flavobacteriales bacterium]